MGIEVDKMSSYNDLKKTINFLKKKDKILLLTTSNRWEGSKDIPKSTQLAKYIEEELKKLNKKVNLIDVTKLKIYPCEGNVSDSRGNNCGVLKAQLKDKSKNPTGYHRCWASFNNKDDELWRISKLLFESDVVLFFGSVRWGQMNSFYQKLIERLTWIENRHSTLKESNIIKSISAGLICVGQNWNESNIIKTQRQVLSFFGFKTPKQLFWYWQYTKNANDESKASYHKAPEKFSKDFKLNVLN